MSLSRSKHKCIFPENQCHSQWVAVRYFTKDRRVAKQAVIGLGNTKRRVSATDIKDLHWTFKVLTANRQPIGNRTGLQSTKMQIQRTLRIQLSFGALAAAFGGRQVLRGLRMKKQVEGFGIHGPVWLNNSSKNTRDPAHRNHHRSTR